MQACKTSVEGKILCDSVYFSMEMASSLTVGSLQQKHVKFLIATSNVGSGFLLGFEKSIADAGAAVTCFFAAFQEHGLLVGIGF